MKRAIHEDDFDEYELGKLTPEDRRRPPVSPLRYFLRIYARILFAGGIATLP